MGRGARLPWHGPLVKALHVLQIQLHWALNLEDPVSMGTIDKSKGANSVPGLASTAPREMGS